MTKDARRALQIETEFLAGFEANVEQAKGRQPQGTTWQTVRGGEEATLRALLASHNRDSRELLKQLPHNRRIMVERSEPRRYWFGKQTTGVMIASVLAPLEHLVAGTEGEMPPVELGELVDHVRSLVTDPDVPHVIGVCSPSGFTDESLNSMLELPNVALVLIDRREEGGWRVSGISQDLSKQDLALFDPEETSRKLDRVRAELEQRAADLLLGGLTASSLAARLSLPEAVVVEAFELAAMADPELKVIGRSGGAVLVRGAATATATGSRQSMLDRIRALLSREGDESEKINLLAEQCAGLTQRRDGIYDVLSKLEKNEADLLDEGRRESSATARRRLANRLAQLRREISRQNTLASMLNAQIDVVSADMHNLRLIQQGQMTKLPDAEELTRNAVRAEEMLDAVAAEHELVSELETGISDLVTADEERAILREFGIPADSEADARDEAPQVHPDDKEGDAQKTHEPPRRAADPEA